MMLSEYWIYINWIFHFWHFWKFLNLLYNDREKQRKATLIINMQGNSTYIKNPEDLKAEPRSFAFDYSYWSHDEFKEDSNGYLQPTGSKYADQVTLSHLHIYIITVFDCLSFVYCMSQYIDLSCTPPSPLFELIIVKNNLIDVCIYYACI